MRTDRSTVFSGQGWTPVPNSIFDSMSELDPVQFKILMFIVRGLLGWKTPRDEFSVRFISRGTGIPRSTVHRHLKFLLQRGVITHCGSGRRGSSRYSLPHSIAQPGQTQTEGSSHLDRSVPHPGHRLYSEEGQSKKTVKKQYISAPDPHRIQSQSPGMEKQSPTDPRTGSELMQELKMSLSSSSYRSLEEAFVSSSGKKMVFRDTLPDHLVFLLRRLPGCSVELVSANDGSFLEAVV